MALTDRKIVQAKSSEKDYFLGDERGLRLLIKANGGKYWRFKYRFEGKQKTLALGVYPDVSLKSARDLREKSRSQIAEGIDPGVEKKRIIAQRKLALANTFENAAYEWWDFHKNTWTEVHANRVWSRLKQHAFPALGNYPLEDIKPAMIIDVVRKIEADGAFDVTKRTLQDIRRIYRYSVQVGKIETNPAESLQGILKPHRTRHRPSLPRSQIGAFLRDLESYQEYGRLLTKLGVELLMLTLVRPGELRNAKWDEFDIENSIWRVPGPRMKMKTEHLVPLSKQSKSVIKEISHIAGRYDFLFPSERSRLRVMSDGTLGKAIKVMGYDGTIDGKAEVTPGGLRTTACSVLNEEGFNADAVERQLSHMERNNVRAAYIHQAQFMEERVRMMQWWADFLDGQRTG